MLTIVHKPGFGYGEDKEMRFLRYKPDFLPGRMAFFDGYLNQAVSKMLFQIESTLELYRDSETNTVWAVSHEHMKDFKSKVQTI